MRTSSAGKATKGAVLKRPSRSKGDDGWATKIAIAKKARSEAIRTRKGKPATFPDHVVNSAR